MNSKIIFFSITLLFSSAAAIDITAVLNQYPSFSTFNSYLSQTHLAEEINARQPPITVLVVDNSNISPLSGKSPDVLKKIMSVHVILDYYDAQKLKNLPGKSQTATTLFQTSGQAMDNQGFLNITDLGNRVVAFASVADKGATLGTNMVKPVETRPYDLSVVQISNVIVPSGIDKASTKAKSPVSSKAKSPVSSQTKSPVSSPAKYSVSSQTKSPVSSPAKSPVSSPAKSPVSTPGKSPVSTPGKAPSARPGKSPVSSPTTGPSASPANGPAAGPANGPVSGPAAGPNTSPASSPRKMLSPSSSPSPSDAPTGAPDSAPESPSPTTGDEGTTHSDSTPSVGTGLGISAGIIAASNVFLMLMMA